ncbi:BamA/TamA family outer membrane protein [Terrimonas rubra]|uniref:BamA/TamA family outer membrane protein n=1 Tax=Terrimonas rubra TaxID=1035890 RepID=A0ABW6ACT8_9BACT
MRFRLFLSILGGIIAIFMLDSCNVLEPYVKHYPPNKPFVYKTDVKVNGNTSKDSLQNITAELENQLDDSLQVRTSRKSLGEVINYPFGALIKHPSSFDSSSISKSIQFMKYYLNSIGYFTDTISFITTVDTAQNDQFRTHIAFDVKLGKQVKLDSVGYLLKDSTLQKITDQNKKDALIKKGVPFAQGIISAELDRLVTLYRNNGYLRFNRDDLFGLWDTLDVSLLQPNLDPFEQFQALEKLKVRRENPTANLEIRRHPLADSTKHWQYTIRNITLYPNHSLDTVGKTPHVSFVKGVKVIQYDYKFKPRIFPGYVYLKSDSLFRQRNYDRTINRFNGLDTWGAVNIEPFYNKGSDTVDFIIRLTPKKKYTFNTNFESSVNQSTILGSLFGVGITAGVQNRNFLKGANITNTNLRYGVELGNLNEKQFIQTRQVSLTHQIYFSRFLAPDIGFIKGIKERFRGNIRSVFSSSIGNTERYNLFNLVSVNGSWGYEFQRRYQRNNWLLNIKLPNIEYSNLTKLSGLNDLIVQNPSLANVFSDGFISSVVANFTLSGSDNTKMNRLFKVNIEQAGVLTGLIKNKFLDSNLYRYIKVDLELARLFTFGKTSLVLRGFAGVGYEFDFTADETKKYNLPFFKQYVAGGPSSMRAWQLRRLGPGSTVKSFTGVGSTPDRFGDVQIEANVEYRFPVAKPFGVPVNGALFTDIGNVWYLKNAPNRPAEEVFKFSRLPQDIAIGAGAGLRIDFSFFVIRFDYAYKIKDPSPSVEFSSYKNKFFAYPFFKGDQFQLGINYPFIF